MRYTCSSGIGSGSRFPRFILAVSYRSIRDEEIRVRLERRNFVQLFRYPSFRHLTLMQVTILSMAGVILGDFLRGGRWG